MKRIAASTALLLFLLALPALGDDYPWVVPVLNETPATHDSGHFVESTQTSPPWSWHSKANLQWLYTVGLADQAAQLRGDFVFGLGFPGRLELNLNLPIAVTMGTPYRSGDDPQGYPQMDPDAVPAGLGDLRAAFLWSVKEAKDGGFGFLVGMKGYLPTGNYDALISEGHIAGEPFISAAFSFMSTTLTLNLAYRIRAAHTAIIGPDEVFEQDDDLIWRVAFRMPREGDVGWSIESKGAIGVATGDGFWPAGRSRPVWIGGGIDFPINRLTRFGVAMGAGITGYAIPLFSIDCRLTWLPVLPDEDSDGVDGRRDVCPLLKEDLDGFEDSDGCPDLDNDGDGFPDDEDACPLKQGDEFSDDGCPDTPTN